MQLKLAEKGQNEGTYLQQKTAGVLIYKNYRFKSTRPTSSDKQKPTKKPFFKEKVIFTWMFERAVTTIVESKIFRK